MKNKCRVLGLVLVFCYIFSTFSPAYAAGVTNEYSGHFDISVELVDGVITETSTFIGVDEKIVYRIFPNDTCSVTQIVDGLVKKQITGTADYNLALSCSGFASQPMRAQSSSVHEKFLGQVQSYFRTGPEWQTVSDLAMELSNVFMGYGFGTAAVISMLASQIVLVAYTSCPLWYRLVTKSYEMHSYDHTGAEYFLGYYLMKETVYVYTSSNTSGSNYITSAYQERTNTMPGA